MRSFDGGLLEPIDLLCESLRSAGPARSEAYDKKDVGTATTSTLTPRDLDPLELALSKSRFTTN